MPSVAHVGVRSGEGKLIRSFIYDRGFTSAKHTQYESLVDACNHMRERDVSSWNMSIASYRKRGRPQEALSMFHRMNITEIPPDPFTFANILPACAKMGALEQGIQIHQRIIERGFLSNIVVANALLDMYAKCRRIQKACQVFDKMHQRNVVSWNGMISGYTQNGDLDQALRIFRKMSNPNVVSWNAIISGYVERGVLDKGLRLFKEMPQRNIVSWTTMIAGYAQNGFVEKALEIFKQMQVASVKPDSATFASILPACAKSGALEHGMQLHQKIIESAIFPNVVVVNALIDMYAKCKCMHKARTLFDKMSQRDAVSWNSLIAGYTQNDCFDEALWLFKEMPQPNVVSWNAIISGYVQNKLDEKALQIFKEMHLASVKPDSATLSCILTACARIGALEVGMQFHKIIIECSFLSDVVVITSLIDMYAKCGSIQKSRKLFDKMPQPNVVSWNAIIAGYAQNGVLDEALKLFKQMPQRDVVSWTAIIAGYAQNGLAGKSLEFFNHMRFAGVKPNSATFASIIPVCAKMGALDLGMQFHQRIIENGILSRVVVNALIDMYAKCGSIQKARKLFDKLQSPNLVSWTIMIAGYAMHGYGKDALKLFELMKDSRIDPNHVSFVWLLLACSHAGLVEEGCKYFNCIGDCYATMDHCVCVVDLLSRAGYLEEAYNFIIKMPLIPEVALWMSLLGSSKSHKNIGLGEFVGTLLLELDPGNAAPYVLLSDMYAEVGFEKTISHTCKAIHLPCLCFHIFHALCLRDLAMLHMDRSAKKRQENEHGSVKVCRSIGDGKYQSDLHDKDSRRCQPTSENAGQIQEKGWPLVDDKKSDKSTNKLPQTQGLTESASSIAAEAEVAHDLNAAKHQMN